MGELYLFLNGITTAGLQTNHSIALHGPQQILVNALGVSCIE